jgi:MYXO-CTERM domain-containing protein
MMRWTFTIALMLELSTTAAAERRFEVARHAVVDTNEVVAARAQSRTVYLNKTGITVTPGSNDARMNRSSIVTSMSSVPAWNASSTVWSQTVTCLREMFAPFDVAITETDPGNVPHIEAVFGGHPSHIGMGNTQYAGVSPFSSTCKIIENSIVFTFTDVIGNHPQAVCEVMAQEIAHSYGLDHELLASDPMTYLPYSGKRTFQNQMASCGESTARDCGLPSFPKCRDGQNSYALLMERIGAAGTGDIDAPVVAITSPMNGAVVEPGFAITATVTDDVIVKFAALSIDGVAVGSLSAAPWMFVAPADLAPGTHTIEIKATDGKNEKTATIDVVVPEDEDSGMPNPLPGCSSGGGGTGWLFGLLLVGLVAIQRRAQR